MRIEAANPEHVPEIVALAQTYNLEQITSEQAAKLGFLASRFEEEDYQAFVRRANHFYVLLDNKTLSGFVYAYSSDRIQDDERLNLLIKSRHPDPFIVIKQICVRQDSIGRGLGTCLYRHLFGQVHGYPIFTAILLEPVNHRSITFHERHGFKKVYEITPPDGMLRGVWMRSP